MHELEDLSERVTELGTSSSRPWLRQTLLDHEQIAEAMDVMPDAVMILDPEGKLAYANRACEILLGYTAREMVGKSLVELLTYARP